MCAMNRAFGFEPRLGFAMLERFGGAVELFSATEDELNEALGQYCRARYAPGLSPSAFESAAMELEGLEAEGIRFVCFGETGYPGLLTECEDPPLGLYYKGVSPPEDVFGGIPAVSVVGTRDISFYGKDWCRRIVGAMSKAPVRPLVVSGLAIGVDGTAHMAALDEGLPTVAVMATGIDRIYPAVHKELGERIASTPGCALVTDYPPGTEAVRLNFLRRNRIIAGIGRATILVESKIKGGGMMTARLASSYGRDLYALPGRVDDPCSQGCNLLIKETLAESIGDPAELVRRMGLGKVGKQDRMSMESCVESFYKGKESPETVSEISRMARLVHKKRGISLDELSSELKWSFSKTSRYAALLECDGFIEMDLLQHCSAAPGLF